MTQKGQYALMQVTDLPDDLPTLVEQELQVSVRNQLDRHMLDTYKRYMRRRECDPQLYRIRVDFLTGKLDWEHARRAARRIFQYIDNRRWNTDYGFEDYMRELSRRKDWWKKIPDEEFVDLCDYDEESGECEALSDLDNESEDDESPLLITDGADVQAQLGPLLTTIKQSYVRDQMNGLQAGILINKAFQCMPGHYGDYAATFIRDMRQEYELMHRLARENHASSVPVDLSQQVTGMSKLEHSPPDYETMISSEDEESNDPRPKRGPDERPDEQPGRTPRTEKKFSTGNLKRLENSNAELQEDVRSLEIELQEAKNQLNRVSQQLARDAINCKEKVMNAEKRVAELLQALDEAVAKGVEDERKLNAMGELLDQAAKREKEYQTETQNLRIALRENYEHMLRKDQHIRETTCSHQAAEESAITYAQTIAIGHQSYGRLQLHASVLESQLKTVSDKLLVSHQEVANYRIEANELKQYNEALQEKLKDTLDQLLQMKKTADDIEDELKSTRGDIRGINEDVLTETRRADRCEERVKELLIAAELKEKQLVSQYEARINELLLHASSIANNVERDAAAQWHVASIEPPSENTNNSLGTERIIIAETIDQLMEASATGADVHSMAIIAMLQCAWVSQITPKLIHILLPHSTNTAPSIEAVVFTTSFLLPLHVQTSFHHWVLLAFDERSNELVIFDNLVEHEYNTYASWVSQMLRNAPNNCKVRMASLREQRWIFHSDEEANLCGIHMVNAARSCLGVPTLKSRDEIIVATRAYMYLRANMYGPNESMYPDLRSTLISSVIVLAILCQKYSASKEFPDWVATFCMHAAGYPLTTIFSSPDYKRLWLGLESTWTREVRTARLTPQDKQRENEMKTAWMLISDQFNAH